MMPEPIRDFLGEQKVSNDRIPVVLEEIRNAAEAYEGLVDRQPKRRRGRERRKQLKAIRDQVAELKKRLWELDKRNQEALKLTLGLESFNATLVCVTRFANELGRLVGGPGRPIDPAFDRWIRDLAAVYRRAFKKEPSASGRFYRLVEVCWPDSTRSPPDSKRVDRALKRAPGA